MKSSVVTEAFQVDGTQLNLQKEDNRLHILPHSHSLCLLLLSFISSPIQRKSCRGSIQLEYPLIMQLGNLKSYHALSAFIEGHEKFSFKGNNYSWFFRGHVTAVFIKDNYYAEQLLYNNW